MRVDIQLSAGGRGGVDLGADIGRIPLKCDKYA